MLEKSTDCLQRQEKDADVSLDLVGNQVKSQQERKSGN